MAEIINTKRFTDLFQEFENSISSSKETLIQLGKIKKEFDEKIARFTTKEKDLEREENNLKEHKNKVFKIYKETDALSVEIRKQIGDYNNQIEELIASKTRELNDTKNELAQLQSYYQKSIENLKSKFDKELSVIKDNYQKEISVFKDQSKAEIEQIRQTLRNEQIAFLNRQETLLKNINYYVDSLSKSLETQKREINAQRNDFNSLKEGLDNQFKNININSEEAKKSLLSKINEQNEEIKRLETENNEIKKQIENYKNDLKSQREEILVHIEKNYSKKWFKFK